MAPKESKSMRVTLLHSDAYTQILEKAMGFIHQDRDILLASLLYYCGFLRSTPDFFRIVSPRRANRKQLESFHEGHYLDVLEQYEINHPLPLLEVLGLVEDCALPSSRLIFWKYCQYVAGASIQAADSLVTGGGNVAIHWGGGRHHAHPGQAGGFCFINDVSLAIERLLRKYKRILYLDIDIHHGDGVQQTFYESNNVLTVSFHRYAPGFYPGSSGSAKERGRKEGVGYNLNLPMPAFCNDSTFVPLYQYALQQFIETFDPQAIVLCVGADGLQNDPLVVGNHEGWNLTPEGLAECVRFTSQCCSDRKLLLLGGGGYHPAQTARTYLLCTAAACEGVRPGMLRQELPRDIPRHPYFERYGPDFVLYQPDENTSNNDDINATSLNKEVKESIDLAVMYLQQQQQRVPDFAMDPKENIPILLESVPRKRKRNKTRKTSKSLN